jgi:hypothetical protein
MSVDSYNSDKVKLQESITKVYDTLKENPSERSTYPEIQKETNHRSYKQELVYQLVSAVAIVSVLFTIRRFASR